jgi:Lrp/AsnC family leucine-responsive transcriptional regulator
MEHVMKEEEIMECYSVTGEGSHILKVMTHNTGSLERFLSRIQSWPGVLGTNTSFVLSQLKKNNRISAEIVRNNLQDRQVLLTFDEKKSRK